MPTVECRPDQTTSSTSGSYGIQRLADTILDRITHLESTYKLDLSEARSQVSQTLQQVEFGSLSEAAGRLSLIRTKFLVDKEGIKQDLSSYGDNIHAQAQRALADGVNCNGVLDEARQIVSDHIQRLHTCRDDTQLDGMSNYAHNQLMRLNNQISKLARKHEIERLLSSKEKLHGDNPTICGKIQELGKQAIADLHLDNPVWVLSIPRMDRVVKMLKVAIDRMTNGETSMA